MKFKLLPGQTKSVNLEHRYMRVVKASDSFEVQTGDSVEFELSSRQMVDFIKPRVIQITNRKAHDIELELSTSAYEVREVDTFKLAEDSRIQIEGVPVVDLAPGASLDVGKIEFTDEAEIFIKSGSEVGVNNFPQVQDVEVLAMPGLQVLTMPDVTIGHKVEADTTGALTGLDAVTFDTNLKSVLANSTRKMLEIKADINNAGNVFIGGTAADKGIPIGRGETWSGKVTAALNLWATDTGDKVYIAEVEGV